MANLGVIAAHCPRGLTTCIWRNAVDRYIHAKKNGKPGGAVISAPNTATDNNVAAKFGGARAATVTNWYAGKSYGFVRLDTGKEEGKTVFFHHSVVVDRSLPLSVGVKVIVQVGAGRNGRPACSSVEAAVDYSAVTVNETGQFSLDQNTISVPCFSMNQPFASLVAHGFKTLETRNSTVLADLAGKWVALHVGQRTYPDGGMHKKIMRRNVPDAGHNSLSEADINRLTSLPVGYRRGHVVALLEIGETQLLETTALRAASEIELRAVATATDMGKYLTKIKSASWLVSSSFECLIMCFRRTTYFWF